MLLIFKIYKSNNMNETLSSQTLIQFWTTTGLICNMSRHVIARFDNSGFGDK
jgi:hypothetical protein